MTEVTVKKIVMKCVGSTTLERETSVLEGGIRSQNFSVWGDDADQAAVLRLGV